MKCFVPYIYILCNQEYTFPIPPELLTMQLRPQLYTFLFRRFDNFPLLNDRFVL